MIFTTKFIVITNMDNYLINLNYYRRIWSGLINFIDLINHDAISLIFINYYQIYNFL